MQIDIYNDASAFEKLRSEWNPLVHKSVTDSFFLTWEWQSAWWQTLGSGKACIMAFRDGDGALVGIAPMFWEIAGAGGVALSPIGCSVSDYLDVIAAKGCEEQIYNALLDTLTRSDFPQWDIADFCNIPTLSPLNTRLKSLAETRGLEIGRASCRERV